MKTFNMLRVMNLLLLAVILVIFSCKKEEYIGPPDTTLKDDGPDRAIPYNYADWMAYIDDSKYICQISIPGTHDCGADEHTSQQGTLAYVVICQDFRLSNQLQMGVRWFDVRLMLDGTALTVHHSSFYLHKNFDDLLNDALSFLAMHNSEIVVFMIKQEHSSASNDDFAHAVWNRLIAHSPDLSAYYLGDQMPKVGDIRGKLWIVRRFDSDGGNPMGPPLIWGDNTSGAYYASNHFGFYVQDHYNMAGVLASTKIDQIKDCCRKAHNEPHPTQYLYINFTSGERGVQSLVDITQSINQPISDWLGTAPVYNNCGVIMINFAGGSDNGQVSPDLLKTIITINEFTIPKVVIGNQVWMRRNLDVTNYRNGDPIPNVTGNNAWSNLTTGAYSDYNNDPNNAGVYGRLYNWYAATDPRGLCPSGWHVPTNDDWDNLIMHIGSLYTAGGYMKEPGTWHWASPNTGATNSSGFTALPAGFRDYTGQFQQLSYYAHFWSQVENSSTQGWMRWLVYDQHWFKKDILNKPHGASIRCIQD